METMWDQRISFRRFLFGFLVFLSAVLCLAVFRPSFTVTPLKACMSIQLTNASNETAQDVRFDFQLSDKRIGFSDAVYTLIQTPTDTSIMSTPDGSRFTLYLPEWAVNEQIRFLIDNITVSSDFPLDFSSMSSNPVYYPIPSEPKKTEFDAVFSIIGKTFWTQSISSFHQFTYNGTLQPLEKRTQIEDHSDGFFVFLTLLVLLISLSIWSPGIWRKLPFATLLLALLMIFIYAFIGSGREIYTMRPFPWDAFKIWPFGTFMHTSDDHILGNLAVFIPLSMLMEIWLNVKSNRLLFLGWYGLPILLAMLFSGIGFSMANEFLAWALWGLIIVTKKIRSSLDLFLCLLSGVLAYTFFGWVFAYVPYVFSPMASTYWGETAQIHISFGLIGALILGVITLSFVKSKEISAIFGKEEPVTSEDKEQLRRELSPAQVLRVQLLNSELSSRENSTLVFSTVAASASLAVLVLALASTNLEWFSLEFCMGFLFSLAGFLYREATIFGIDNENYTELRSLLSLACEKSGKVRRLDFLRMVAIRLFLLVPVGNWILVVTHTEAVSWIAVTYLAIFGLAYYLSIREIELKHSR